MPTHSEIRISPYPPEKLFALVLDIERYPEFLPWCRAARIIERADSYFVGELMISFAHITERYSSRVMWVPPSWRGGLQADAAIQQKEKLDCHGAEAPRNDDPVGRIDVTLVNGPFSALNNHWRFIPRPDGGTEIQFDVDFKFKSVLLDRLIGGMFTRAVEKMSRSFMARADALYGTHS